METSRQDHIAGIVAQWVAERPELDASPLLVIGRIAWLAERFDQALRPPFAAAGLSNGDFDVLAALRRVGAPYAMRHRDLCAATLVTPGAVTKRVDRMVTQGYVERQTDSTDARGQHVRLTAAGVRLVDRMIAVHLDNESRLLAGLSAPDRERLAQLLERLAVSVEAEGQ